MKVGDLVIAKHLDGSGYNPSPELILEFDFVDTVKSAIARGSRRYIFWKVLRGDGTIGKLCDILDEESSYEVVSCGSGA